MRGPAVANEQPERTSPCANVIHDGGGVFTTNSLRVALAHGKRHDNLVTLIRKRIAESGDWGVRNFTDTPRINDQNGETYSVFDMTMPGYQFLVGKMTGAKAVAHQIAFINAFTAMLEFVSNQKRGLRYRCDMKELECEKSKHMGSFHGTGLRKRRTEKSVLEAELDALKSLVQPSLLN